MSYANGRLPDSALIDIPGGQLARGGAGEAWLAGPAKKGLRPLGPNSSYRTYAAQLYYWNLYQSGQGNLAAYPGTSNHGWGLAVDLAEQWMRAWIDSEGHKYGWAKTEAFSEWWHVNYDGSVHFPVEPPPLKKGMAGKRVLFLQKCLRRASHNDKRHYWRKGWPTNGKFGTVTRRSVIRFQKQYHLKPDGVVGPKTWRRLKKAAKVR